MKLDLAGMRYNPATKALAEQETGDTHSHYRLTDAGITDDDSGWWYFLRKYENKDNPYWYKKIRKDPTKEHPDGEVVEEYVGLELPFPVPRTWMNKMRRRALGGAKD
jgi:hypothetical protein